MQKPLVSILIPAYNQPEFFRQALESAINQTYSNLEIVVSDDSTDDRVQKAFDAYKKSGRPMRYLKHGNQLKTSLTTEKTALNIENLLSHAQGDFINILFHDDLIHPTKIEKMMKIFIEDEADQIAIVSSAKNLIRNDGSIFSTEDFLLNMNAYHGQDSIFLTGEEVGRLIFTVCGNFVGEFSIALARKDAFYRSCVDKLSANYFLGVKDRSMGDLSVWLEACAGGRGITFLREPLSSFRVSVSESQNTFNENVRVAIVIDWLAFVTAAYLHDKFIHDRTDFVLACKYWVHIASNMLDLFQEMSRIDLKIEENLLDEIIRAIESVENENFDETFAIGVEWIKRFSSDTFDLRRLQ